MTDQGVKVSATPEERARSLVTKHALCRWCGSHDDASGRNFPAQCQTTAALAAEIRSASEAARKAALTEAGRWLEKQAHELRQRAFQEKPVNDVLLRDASIHLKGAAHFRSLSSRGSEQEGRIE